MKKIILFLSVVIMFLPFASRGQYVLYGAATSGGANGHGTVFNYDIITGAYSVSASFAGTNGASPYYGGFTFDTTNDLLYRTVYTGGQYGYGAIVSYGNCTGISTVADFNTNLPDGSVPYGSLAYCPANGMYYGMTEDGGANNKGVLFVFNPLTGSDSVLLNFNGAGNGSYPDGSPTYNPVDGLIYGMTSQGGTNNIGVLFSYDITTGKDSVRVNFDNSNGSSPYGTLAFNPADSLLYGMTNAGGASSSGVLFSYNPFTATDTVLVDFNGTNGDSPNGSLTFNPVDSLLYGMTGRGGANGVGNIFSYDRKTKTLNSLFSFSSADGSYPYGNLTFNPVDSLLYGMTSQGGANSSGVIFSYNAVTQKDSLRLSFDGTRESQPNGDLTFNPSDSLLYGMTQYGGNSIGIVFSFNTHTNTDSVLVNMTDTNGAFPWGSLVYNSSTGLMYGMTSNGGNNENGLIFSYNPVTQKDSVMHAFSISASGNFPQNGGLTYNPSDKLYYGMTTSGGSSDNGTLFRFNPATETDSVLLGFDGSMHGSAPHGNLTYNAADGLFYGMTTSGGANNLGVLFSYNPVNGKDSVRVNFADTNGASPYGSLIYNAANGLLYGMTSSGGTNSDGIIFTYNPLTNKDSVVYNFAGTDGASPYGTLTLNAADGLLYGMTLSGGTNSQGVLFSFDTATHAENVLLSFNTTNGSSPYGDVLLNPAGTVLYGLTYSGGAANKGVLFSYTLSGGKDSVLFSFDGSNGSFPRGNLTLVNISVTPAVSITKDSTICAGTSVTLTASGGSNGSYVWSTGATTGSVTVNVYTDTTYSVTVCKGIYSKDTAVNITVMPAPVVSITATTPAVCAGTKDTLIENATGSGPFTYSWSNGSTTDSAVVNNGATYSVTVTGANGCKSIDTGSITINPLPSVGITGKDTILQGSTDTLTASGGVSYAWTSGSSADTTMVSPMTKTTYTVTATDGNGCSDTASFTVYVDITTSITSPDSYRDLTSLYPNPAAQTIYLSFTMNGTLPAAIKVINADGAAVISMNATISQGQPMPLNIGGLPPGLYFVQVITAQHTQTVRFVKQ